MPTIVLSLPIDYFFLPSRAIYHISLDSQVPLPERIFTAELSAYPGELLPLLLLVLVLPLLLASCLVLRPTLFPSLALMA